MMYLLLAILLSTSIMFVFKWLARLQLYVLPVVVVNYLVALCWGIFFLSLFASKFSFSKMWGMYPAYLSGVLFILVFLVFGESTRRVGIAITSVSSKMSVVIPVMWGVLIWKEELNWVKWMAIWLTLLAFVFVFYQPRREAKAPGKLWLPLLLFLSSGINDLNSKFGQSVFCKTTFDYYTYLTLVFGISLVIGFVILFVKASLNELNTIKTWFWGFLLGSLNWFSTYFFLQGMSVFDVSVFLPVFNVSIVTLGALMGILFFGEKFHKVNLLGYLFALVAIVLILI